MWSVSNWLTFGSACWNLRSSGSHYDTAMAIQAAADLLLRKYYYMFSYFKTYSNYLW